MPFGDRFSFFRRSDPTSYQLRQDDGHTCVADDTGRKKQCYSVPSSTQEHRRERNSRFYSGSSVSETSRVRGLGSNKFLSFLYNGFHRNKSKSISKTEKEIEPNIACRGRSLQNIIPIPIKETAIQRHSKTLFRKVPNSNLRDKPLIILTEDSKIAQLHDSILPNRFTYCVEILSKSPDIRLESGVKKYELTLPTGAQSLGQSCRIVTDDDMNETCSACHPSQKAQHSSEKVMGYIFSCNNIFEQEKWINALTRVARPNQQDQRRKEISLNLWLQEAKNVPIKKRYFCEIYLDGSVHARTTTKMMGDMLFWGEEFNLCNLDDISVVTLLLWKSAEEGRSKKKKSQQQLICQINISTKEIDQRTSIEKWYSPSSSYNPNSPETPPTPSNMGFYSSANTIFVPLSQSVQIPNILNPTTTSWSQDSVPMVRIKAKYQRLDVLPLSSYRDFMNFLNENGVSTLSEIEPYLKVKAKEDMAQNLVKVIHKQGTAVPILCDLIINEINKSEDNNLILRGNTMASKAMEIYLKLIGEKYLHLTLSDFIKRVLSGQDDCEVNPHNNKTDLNSCTSPTGNHPSGSDKSNQQFSLHQRQESLMMNVDMVWAKIMSSSIYFPKDFKTVFITLRQRLIGFDHINQLDDQPDLCDRIISACIFLRYICPAILTPSLFGLIPEYPDNPKVTRTFTLVAKCIQTLANFSNLCGTKEAYMVFMNKFIENNFKTMRDFLREISAAIDADVDGTNTDSENSTTKAVKGNEYLYWENISATLPEDSIDLALCLATLHRQMEDCLDVMQPQKYSKNLKDLHSILENINTKLKQEDITFSPSMSSPHTSNQSSNHVNDSNSTKITPTHESMYTSLTSAECSTGQSTEKGSKITTSIDQIDKEWKAVLSASYVYRNRSKERFFSSESTDVDTIIKSTNSSGYQTLSRSTDTLEKPSGRELSIPKSPSLPLKPSVKKCKQIRRQNEIPSQTNTAIINSHKNVNRSQESRKPTKENDPHRSRISDISSTETLKVTTVPIFETLCVTEGRSKLVYSKSMPAFQSSLENQTYHISEFKSAFHEYNKDHYIIKSSTIHREFVHLDDESAFQDTKASILKSNNRKNNMNKHRGQNNPKVIKRSLDNLRQNFNVRMKRLILADRTTIQLELERVKLMKRICCDSDMNLLLKPNDIALCSTNNYQSTDVTIKNENSLTSGSSNTKTISINKYLDLAETVLANAYNAQMKVEEDKDNILTMNMEDLLAQIFQTNQSLQNTLMSRSETTNSFDDFSKTNFQKSIRQKEETPCHTQKPDSTNISTKHKKSNSTGSLMIIPTSEATVKVFEQV